MTAWSSKNDPYVPAGFGIKPNKMKNENTGCTEITISDEELMQINPEGKPLTPEILRSLTGEDFNDEEAQEIIFALTTFCTILLEAAMQEEKQAVEKSLDPNINQLKQAA